MFKKLPILFTIVIAAAKARQALDKAVNVLVTDYLAIAIDVQ